MKIRAITCFCQPGWPVNRLLLEQMGIFARHARAEFERAGYKVQGLRLATTPPGEWLPPEALPEAATSAVIDAHANGFEFTALGPILPGQDAYYAQVLPILAQNPGSFITASLTTAQGELSFQAARQAAEIICQLSTLETNGFANLRFSALANVAAYAPFFPSAYAAQAQPAFGLALQAADLANQAFENAPTLLDARDALVRGIEAHAAELLRVAENLARIYRYRFTGLDFTLAPHPEDGYSIANALQNLGLPVFGLHGSTLAAAFLTDTLDRARYPRCGFNGLMLPVLEDSSLAAASALGVLSTQNLLLNSAVCGTGLDVVPLPGDTTAEQIYPLLLDLGALALRLNKPLTARLMPIPGKKAGESTAFNFEYFANASILPLSAEPLTGLLAAGQNLPIGSRTPGANLSD